VVFFHLSQVEPHLKSLLDGSSHLTTKTSRILARPSTSPCLNDWLFSAISWLKKIQGVSKRALQL
jgi:hypothetical protein